MDSSVSDYISHCLAETGTCPKAPGVPPAHKPTNVFARNAVEKYANLKKLGEESRVDHHGHKPGSREAASVGRTRFYSSAPLVKASARKSQDTLCSSVIKQSPAVRDWGVAREKKTMDDVWRSIRWNFLDIC